MTRDLFSFLLYGWCILWSLAVLNMVVWLLSIDRDDPLWVPVHGLLFTACDAMLLGVVAVIVMG